MAVNIFGAARGNKISENDQKFKTLSLNLASKLDKSGGNVDGDLKMLLNGDEIRTFGVSDISSGKSVSFLLGDVENQIRNNYGHAIKIAASHGVKFTSPGGEICQIGTQHDANLSMRNNYIKDLHDPEFAQDAASKYYVDNIHSYNGYIPILESHISCLGFSASANASSSPRYQPFNAFNNLNDSWVRPSTSGWLQIKCPEQVKIWRVALKARQIDGRDITAWNLTASNNGTDFNTLINSTITLLGSATCPTFIEVIAHHAYQYYRLNITASTGSVDVGVQVFQLYIVG